MDEKNRKKYFKHYQDIGSKMFTECVTPTVGDFVKAYVDNDKKANAMFDEFKQFTGTDLSSSVRRRLCNYSEEDSNTFMEQVIAANVTDITESGYFYKKLASSTDGMTIDIDDCGSKGEEIELTDEVVGATDEEFEIFFKYRLFEHWITELDKYVTEFKDVKKLRGKKIHVRSFLSCKRGTRCFCKKCAGLFRRSYQSEFTPKNIGIYATYMITEHATQASLDSMNKGCGEKINKILEVMDDDMKKKIKNIDDAKQKIREIIDYIGWVGVESRFYEIALLSRWRGNSFVSMKSSIHKQSDYFGSFIFSPNKSTLIKLVNAGTFEADSLKTKIAFDEF